MDHAEAVWAQVKDLLRTELPKRMFDAWVRDSEGIGLTADRLTVAVANGYARDWLEDNLTTAAARLVRMVLDRPVEVRFEVWQEGIPAEEPSGSEDSTEQRPCSEGDQPRLGEPDATGVEDEALRVELALSSLRELFRRSWQIVAIEGYFRRWIPFLGATLAWIVVALRQLLYLATAGSPAEGQAFQTSMDEIARWSGLTKRTVLNHLSDPESLRRLAWFLAPAAPPASRGSRPGGRRSWVVYEDARGRRRGKPAPNRYQFQALMPLTPIDAETLVDRLRELGVTSDPVAALERALKARREELLADPPARPRPADLSRRPQPQSVQDVVREACGTLDPRTAELADRLAALIMPRKDRIMPSHYLIQHWLPLLGPGPGWGCESARDG